MSDKCDCPEVDGIVVHQGPNCLRNAIDALSPTPASKATFDLDVCMKASDYNSLKSERDILRARVKGLEGALEGLIDRAEMHGDYLWIHDKDLDADRLALNSKRGGV